MIAPRSGPARAGWKSWSILAVGVVSVSVSAILIRYAREAEPLAISMWRCTAGALALLPFARFGATSTLDLKMPVIAGIFLAVHFATWITSLELTSVAASVLLVSTTPIFVAGAAALFFKERLSGAGWLGVALSFAGAGIIAAGQGGGESSMGGNLLALAGGATAGGYLLAGRVSRRDLGINEFAVLTYGTAAICLLPACLLGQVPLWGYDGQTWLAIAGMVIGPQLLGHTLINLVLDDLDTTTVSMTIMVEPIIATILAFSLFQETPSGLIYPGGVAILIGIYLVTRVRAQPALAVD